MNRSSLAQYLGEQMRNMRSQLARLEQLADELAISEEAANQRPADQPRPAVK